MNDLSRVHLDAWYDPPRPAELRSTRDQRWLDRAAKVAALAEGRWRVGCVLVRSGRVLAASANSVRNDPAVCGALPWRSSEHAEMGALRLAGDAAGATAYVARLGSDGKWRHAQPCRRCQYWFDALSIHAVWTSDPEYIERMTARARSGSSLPLLDREQL